MCGPGRMTISLTLKLTWVRMCRTLSMSSSTSHKWKCSTHGKCKSYRFLRSHSGIFPARLHKLNISQWSSRSEHYVIFLPHNLFVSDLISIIEKTNVTRDSPKGGSDHVRYAASYALTFWYAASYALTFRYAASYALTFDMRHHMTWRFDMRHHIPSRFDIRHHIP